MQLLLSLESGSVCHTHSRQDLKHLVHEKGEEGGKKATKVLIFTLAKESKALKTVKLVEMLS